MMKGLSWARVVFVLTLLQSTGSELIQAPVVELGSAVVLPCPSLTGESGCRGVSWIFSRIWAPAEPDQDPNQDWDEGLDRDLDQDWDQDQEQDQDQNQELVRDGQMVNGSGRMELMRNCSLLLNRVQDQDVGLYSCSHLHTAPRRRPTALLLSVVRGLARDGLGELAGCALSAPVSGRFSVTGAEHRESLWCSVKDRLTGRVWPFWRTDPVSNSQTFKASRVAVVLLVLILFT